MTTLATDAIRFVKELYPRLDPDGAAIERYQHAIDRLPPIVVARDGVLVDGYHRWQAHRREGTAEIEVENLGDLTDAEIVRESYSRNATHGQQLSQAEKIDAACHLYTTLGGSEDDRYAVIADVLSLSDTSAKKYAAKARTDEQRRKKDRAWDLWLDCWTQTAIAAEISESQQTVSNWLQKREGDSRFCRPPRAKSADPSESDYWNGIAHFDIWQFGSDGGDSGYFGRMPPQVVENLLWLWTEPGQVIVDPFAGSGTTIRVAKTMGRRVWASDRRGAFWDETLPIHTHDITQGWPAAAPARADLILLDPPYWQQAAGRYSNDPDDLGNMDLDEFLAAWSRTIKTCAEHLADDGRLVYIVSPAQDGSLEAGRVVDLAFEMYRICHDRTTLDVERRVIVPYSTQQATGQQVDAAREQRRLLKLYRDLVVMRP